jgi:hypothetical protein
LTRTFPSLFRFGYALPTGVPRPGPGVYGCRHGCSRSALLCDPRRRYRFEALAAVPSGCAQVPARPDRHRQDAAARHLGRLEPISGGDRIMVVTGRAHRAAVESQLPDLADHNVVLESEPKDSSAAIGLAAAILDHREPGVIIGSFAADHVISDVRGFRRAIVEAVTAADAGFIATIGITPTEPAIGFGYIHCGPPLDDRRRAERRSRSTLRREAELRGGAAVPRRWRLPVERRHVHFPGGCPARPAGEQSPELLEGCTELAARRGTRPRRGRDGRPRLAEAARRSPSTTRWPNPRRRRAVSP